MDFMQKAAGTLGGMSTLEIVAAAFGVMGIAVSIIIYQQKKGKKLLKWKLVSDIVWLIQYALLGKFTGACSCLVGAVRETVFLNQPRKWAKSKLWLIFFIALSVGLSVATWGSMYSAFPMTASVIAVFSFWRGNPTLTKILVYPICLCMITYDIFGTGEVAYMGIVNEALMLISTTVSLVLGGIENKKKKRLADSSEISSDNAENVPTEA